MKNGLSKTRGFLVSLNRTVDHAIIARSRRFVFWILVAATLLNGFAAAYWLRRGKLSDQSWYELLTAAYAIMALVSGVRILKSRSGFLAKD
jgi:hypothetical protein